MHSWGAIFEIAQSQGLLPVPLCKDLSRRIEGLFQGFLNEPQTYENKYHAH